MSQERLRQAKSRDEIKVGVVIVMRGCGRCDGDHRGMVDGFLDCLGEWNGTLTAGSGFSVIPAPGCVFPQRFAAIPWAAIPMGRIWIVEDGLDEQADAERTEKEDREQKEAEIDRVLAKVCR